MGGLQSEFRHAARSLGKSPGFTAVAVLTLALGIGANTAVFSLLNAVMLRPLPYADPGRLVLIWESAPFFGIQDSPVSPANYVDWKKRAQSFAEMGALEINGYRLTGGGPPELVLGAVVTAGLFRALGTRPLLGRVFRDEEDRVGAAKVAVISESLWRRRFGADPGIVGQTVRLGDEKHTIVGVLASGTEPPSEYVSKLGEIWTPLGAAYSPQQWNNRGRHNWMVIARLKPGVTLARADAEMHSIGQALAHEYPDTNEKVGAFVAPLRDHFVEGSRRILTLLFSTVAFVLLIACSNLANLLLSRAAGRRKEVSVRAALGAGTWHIARRFVCESLLVSTAGSALGIVLATATFRFLAHLAPGDMTGMSSLSVDLRVLGFTAALSIAVATAFSLVPLLQLRRLDLIEALKQNARTLASSRSNRTRALLAGSQVALAFVLAIGAALLIQTFARLRGVDTGFRTHNVLTVGLPRFVTHALRPAEIASWQQEVLRRVEAIPGVVSAGFTNHVPIAFQGDINGVTAEGRNSREMVECQSRVAGPGYLATMGIPVLRGRDIAETDRDGAPLVVLVNETLARELWPDQDPVGRKLVFGSDVFARVIGVTRDIRQDGLDAAPKPEYYLSSLQAGFHPGALAIHTKLDPASIAGAVRQAVWSVDPQQPLTDVFTMDQILDSAVLQRKMQATLLAVFAGLALLLAAIGLYGVLAYAVGQRLPEFGVRMALGASPRALLANVIGQGLKLTVLGLAAGTVAALALSRLMAAFLFGVRATDPTTYAVVAGLLLFTAGLASYLPGRRAMRVDPAVALRQE
ncbi:MAG TPA: ABC transporter permease [Bryobacteraceae bacterium]|nr:ABC transporter permease [Bryobacteraceae bacterium]